MRLNKPVYVLAVLVGVGLVMGASSCDVQTNQTSSGGNQAAEAPPKAPDPIALSGAGQQATGKFRLERGLAIFRMQHNGGSNFAPKLMDNAGELTDLLTNEIGTFNGSKAVGITTAGEYLIDVTADGSWSINIEQPRVADAQPQSSFSGTGQQVTGLFHLNKGLKTFRMSHQGSSNFAPKLLDKNGRLVELLANEIGIFNGSKAARVPSNGVYLLMIEADGNWTLSIE